MQDVWASQRCEPERGIPHRGHRWSLPFVSAVWIIFFLRLHMRCWDMLRHLFGRIDIWELRIFFRCMDVHGYVSTIIHVWYIYDIFTYMYDKKSTKCRLNINHTWIDPMGMVWESKSSWKLYWKLTNLPKKPGKITRRSKAKRVDGDFEMVCCCLDKLKW